MPQDTHTSRPQQPEIFSTIDKPVRSQTRPNTVDPVRVHFSKTWLAGGALAGAAGMAALIRYGKPVLWGGIAFGAAALGHMILGEPQRPVLERIDLPITNLPPALEGLRIGQLSDLHLGQPFTANNLRWAVEQLRRERPDLIVLTGDQVMHHHAIPQLSELLRGVHAPLGVYAITGNHDYWEGVRDIEAALALCDIPLLINQNRQLTWRGQEFWLVGVDDVWDGHLDYETALRGVPNDGFKILLGHASDIADEAATHGFALQLAGHVHGGHIRLPLIGPFVRPRFGMRYLDGIYQVGQMTMYVSRGLGGTPLRLLCPPEATILTLRRAA
jgi:predicted MPP superfamily phosphohydrolase